MKYVFIIKEADENLVAQNYPEQTGTYWEWLLEKAAKISDLFTRFINAACDSA